MTHIVDRRFDSKNKSSVNRSRFLRRFKGQIRKAVANAIDKSGIRDLDDGRKIGIPGRDIAEPQFSHGRGGMREQVYPGNDRFSTGEEMDRPPQGGGGKGGSQGSPDGEGYDDFVFTLSREEFLDIFFDELALPNLVKRQLASAKEFRTVRAGYTQTGMPTNINFVRTMRGAAGRRIAVGSGHLARLQEALAELEQHAGRSEDDPEVVRLRLEIARLRMRLDAVPFIDDFDLRFNNRVRISMPSTQAVMFCVMDVSGSMDEDKKNTAKRFFTLLYLFLKRNYERIDLVFIRHHTVAEEVDEDGFFHSRETGGTVVSSALKLMRKVIEERYSSASWNIYGAQASDGDNWQEDSSACQALLSEQILPLTQYFAYIEIASDKPQSLWHEYERVQASHAGTFAMRRILALTDIYPVFHELFKKRV
jgi:uncharacterized sporulation protein YeaH/YhbH (DUF444 family)